MTVLTRRASFIIAVNLFLTLFLIPISSHAGWGSHGYFEYRHGILSNEPSLIGRSDCPCMGFQTTLGLQFHPFGIDRWETNTFSRMTGQTRWDSPETNQFTLDNSFRLFKNFSLLAGYTEIHNLDRPTPKGTQYVDWEGIHTFEPGKLGWGWSGVRTLYAGFRVNLW